MLFLGDVVYHDDQEWIVDLLSESRARLLPLTRKKREFETVGGKKVEFSAPESHISISPNSEIKVIRRLGVNWKEKLKE